MTDDSLTFQLSSLVPFKGEKNENLDPRKKDQSAKCQSMMLLALIFKSSMFVTKIVKNKNQKTKIVVPFIYSSFSLISTVIFHFHQLYFKNKILSRIANIYDDY